MKNTNNDDARITERRQRVATLYVSGRTQTEIARLCSVEQGTISKDLAAIRLQWKAEAIVDFEERLLVELAKIDQLEMIAFEAWERSCAPAEQSSTKEEKVRKEPPKPPAPVPGAPIPRRRIGHATMVPVKLVSETVTRGRDGNPAFLDRIAWCIETRLRLMGALKGDKAVVNVVNINWDDLHTTRDDGPDMLEVKIASVKPVTPPHEGGTNGSTNGSTGPHQ